MNLPWPSLNTLCAWPRGSRDWQPWFLWVRELIVPRWTRVKATLRRGCSSCCHRWCFHLHHHHQPWIHRQLHQLRWLLQFCTLIEEPACSPCVSRTTSSASYWNNGYEKRWRFSYLALEGFSKISFYICSNWLLIY